MSFYVTLPSNSSMLFFPNNSLTNYITKLKRNIKLEGEYEVASRISSRVDVSTKLEI